ncbi:MAG: hypothetical protein A2600_00150 [Candidatus Lambdaproteobacteria bacterium RIFOXYD1_FULL_56_27]|uniref:histidine kinase n=1 Tax=Candidatus Lambdaproteobacteria bacterium RIFOXYD2_FULL_56_26 TaxID=1817773 RepID=A0A1F6GPG6_9PROT|nr:MAG: hypothetical protein A2557_04270 [Candidatus Lambdaproteobacteria bacterium RIFOXYD2_FULL_56_26]OGH03928.1 MAG: hypothetical protein A2426_07495 [Candidatus Lambdaproteobacteria bacterium RIFOXYC1_FULL_56_13]OGH06185.1 MAG: hypothetical protein A2600_00150 [Candidatus Lambdaproteobacteria bacterium RIFOXYD1_FULL_56_27]
MNPKKLIWQIFPPLLLVFVTAMLLLSALVANRYSRFFVDYVSRELLLRAKVLEPELAKLIEERQWVLLGGIAERLASGGDVRVTLVSLQGEFLADSLGHLSAAEELAGLEEIQRAIQGESLAVQRFGFTEQREMLYVARPVLIGVHPVGVVRIGVPLDYYTEMLSWTRPAIAGLALGLGLAAALASLLVVRRVSIPLEEIQKQAQAFAQGDLTVRLPGFESLELDRLSRALNLMAKQLEDRFETIDRQKCEQEAIFAGIGEGLLVLDPEGRITNLNPAAMEILSLGDAYKKKLVEIVRNPALETFVQKTLLLETPVTAQIEIYQTDKVVRATGTALTDGKGRQIGVLLALYDLTHLLRLENVRKEFVANVSHELKTPITAIKGFVETLQDGAKDDPAELERFLAIIARQTGRLEMIVEDLLSLARIEQDGFEQAMERERTDLKELCKGALQLCQPNAKAKGISLILEEGEPHKLEINPRLVEQALINLLDNAIKYSGKGKEVRIGWFRSNQNWSLEVKDQGLGIPVEALPRIFERFYRVDKARSGNDLSTGLGLSIVKNIMKLHKGRVEVESQLGKGSSFRLLFPLD